MHMAVCTHTYMYSTVHRHTFVMWRMCYDFLCNAFSFSVMHQNFKWEEQNFVVQNEINNMEFLVNISKNTRPASKVGTDTCPCRRV